MDDDLLRLEAELRRLRPRVPSPELTARIGRELATAGPVRRAAVVRGVWAVTVPAAAAIAVWLAPPAVPEAGPGRVTASTAADDPAAGGLRPVRADNVLVAAQDEGLVTLDDGTPARRARLRYVDTIEWRDPRTNASLTWTVPREEVRLVPVSFQ